MTNTLAWAAAGLWLLLLARVWNTRKSEQLHPSRIFAWSWAIMFFISALPIIQFPPIALNAWLYLVTYASLLVIGAGIVAKVRWSSYPKISADWQPKLDPLLTRPHVYKFTKWFIFIGIIGLILNLYVAYFARGTDFSQSGLIRDVGSQLQNRQAGNWMDRVVEFTLPIPWMSFIILLLYSESFKPRVRLLVFVFGAGLFLYGVSTGGRTVMLRMILIFLISLWVRRSRGLNPWPWKLNLTGVSIVAAGLVIGLVYFMYVWVWRAGGLENVSLEVPQYHIDASASPGLSWLLSEVPPSYRGLVVFPSLYLNTEANNFGSTFNSIHIAPLWGFWQLSNWASAFNRLGLPVQSTDTINSVFDTTYANAGYFLAQWRTMAQENILDFGRTGALITAFIYGAVAGYVYRKFQQGKTYYSILLVIVLSWSIYGAWTSPFNSGQLILFIYSFLYIIVVYRLRWKKTVSSIVSNKIAQRLPDGENEALNENSTS